MTISWRDPNQGGPIEDKDILIAHSQFSDEITTVNKLRAEKERMQKLIADSQEKLRKANGKLTAVIDALNIR